MFKKRGYLGHAMWYNWMQIIFMLFSCIWVTLTTCNIIVMITATASSSWWLEPAGSYSGNRAVTAFYRAFSTSFGSIALDAAVRPIVVVRRLMRFFQCTPSTLDILNNPYCIVHIALYGERFKKSAEFSAQFLNQAGYYKVIESELTWIPVFFGGFINAGLSTIIGQGLEGRAFTDQQRFAFGGLCFIIGFSSTVLFSVIEGSTYASMINFCESGAN
jgi:hypothetical protein